MIQELFDTINIDNVTSCNLIDITDEEYFSDKYKDYISNSRLSLMKEGPDSYFNGIKQEASLQSVLDFGSAVHALVLQPNDYYLVEEINKPNGKPGLIVDWLIKNKKELNNASIEEASKIYSYYAKSLTQKRIDELVGKIKEFYEFVQEKFTPLENKIPIFLTEYDKYRAIQCVDSILKNSKIVSILKDPGMEGNELTALLNIDATIQKDGETITVPLSFKGKIDNMIIRDKTLFVNDIKTTGHSLDIFPERMQLFSYPRQLALYAFFLKNILKDQIDTIKYNIFAVESIPDFKSRLFELEQSQIDAGFEEAKDLIKKVVYYTIYEHD